MTTTRSNSRVRVFVRLALFLAIATLAVAVSPAPAAAVTGWTGPTKIFDGRYRQISMAIDTNAKVHAAARGKDGLWYFTNRTGSWQRTRLTTKPLDGYDGWPSVSLDSDNRVHIAFERVICSGCVPWGTHEIRYLTDRGRTRGTFPATASLLANGWKPSLQVVNNKLFLAYEGLRDVEGQYPDDAVYFKTNATGSWQTTDLGGWSARRPSLRVGTDGVVHIAFSDEGEIRYARSVTIAGSPDYSSFDVQWLPNTWSWSTDPSLAVDGRNRPHIAWVRECASACGGGTYYARWSGSEWLGGRFTTTYWSVDLTLDAGNQPHLLVLPEAAGVYYWRMVDGELKRQTLSTAAVANSAAIAIASNGRPALLYTAVSGVPAGIYYAKRN